MPAARFSSVNCAIVSPIAAMAQVPDAQSRKRVAVSCSATFHTPCATASSCAALATRAGPGVPLSSSQPPAPQLLPTLPSAAVAAYNVGRPPPTGVWMRPAHILCLAAQCSDGTTPTQLVPENTERAPTNT